MFLSVSLNEILNFQVYHYLMSGQVKSVKPCLKQLQQSIQTIMLPTWPSDEGIVFHLQYF